MWKVVVQKNLVILTEFLNVGPVYVKIIGGHTRLKQSETPRTGTARASHEALATKRVIFSRRRRSPPSTRRINRFGFA